MAKKTKAVKLADIAEALEVSIVTVSKALSDQSGVSEEMRAKIKSLAKEMGYKPLSSLKKAKSENYSIGVLISNRYIGAMESFYWKMYQEVISCTMTKGCFTLLEVIDSVMEKNGTVPRIVSENKADGLIIIGRPGSSYASEILKKIKIPVVNLDFYESDVTADSVISDGFYGTYLMTNYLFDHGHRNICYVGTLFATESITDRFMGFCKSLLEHGITPNGYHIINDRDEVTGVSKEADDISLPSTLPTAFVCNCDRTAALVAEMARNRGLRVPEDVSIVGFDNYLAPDIRDFELTTYEVDIHEMARIAVNTLTRKISGENYQRGLRIVEGRLVERESVKTLE